MIYGKYGMDWIVWKARKKVENRKKGERQYYTVFSGNFPKKFLSLNGGECFCMYVDWRRGDWILD
jgi:hypothetical protein